MSNCEISRAEQARLNTMADLLQHVTSIKDHPHDRIRYVWSLKLIAEHIATLDTVDRENGRLPLQLRPALMLRTEEAKLAMDALREHIAQRGAEVSNKTLSLLDKFDTYFEGAPYSF
jgi:hypothetical protein